MPDMTLQEALQTDEVKGLLSTLIQDALGTLQESWLEDLDIEAKVTAAVEAALPKLQESVQDTVRESGQVRALHREAVRLIEASQLRGVAKANLLEDYGIVESDDDTTVKPCRALALIEAEMDTDGTTVKKTAKEVLKDAVAADVERQRNILRESAPSFPVAPGGGGGGGGEDAPVVPFLGDDSPTAQRLKERGMDTSQFGATPTPAPAT